MNQSSTNFGALIRGIKNEKNDWIDCPPKSWQFEIYQNYRDSITIQKSTQCGISLFSTITSLEMSLEGLNQFYVLPTESLRNRFVSRVNEIIQNNKRYRTQIHTDSVSQKQIANSFLAFVYSNSESQFQEFPADCVTIDELDKCDQDNVKRAVSRLGNSKYRIIRRIGNPSIKDFGIDREMKKTDFRQWNIKCQSCGLNQTPDFFKHVINPDGFPIDRDYRLGGNLRAFCGCGKPIDLKQEGEWIPTKESQYRGYIINKLFSGNVPLEELYEGYREALQDDSALSRFYNDDLGLPYTPIGAKITLEMIMDCVGNYNLESSFEGVSRMGIDVGTKLHTVIMDTKGRLLYAGSPRNKEDILELVHRYNVRIGVIDAMPEQRLVHELQLEIPNLFRCLYSNGNDPYKPKIQNRLIQVDRTSMIDTVKSNLLKRNYVFPQNIQSLDGGDFVNHLQNTTRISDTETGKTKWVDTGADHYLHALVYCDIANSLFVYLQGLN